MSQKYDVPIFLALTLIASPWIIEHVLSRAYIDPAPIYVIPLTCLYGIIVLVVMLRRLARPEKDEKRRDDSARNPAGTYLP